MIQEIITLIVFAMFSIFISATVALESRGRISLIIIAAWFIFHKW